MNKVMTRVFRCTIDTAPVFRSIISGPYVKIFSQSLNPEDIAEVDVTRWSYKKETVPLGGAVKIQLTIGWHTKSEPQGKF